MNDETKIYIKKFEEQIGEPKPPKIIRYTIPENDLFDAQLAAKQLVEWNVIINYKLIIKPSHYELLLYTR